MRYNRKGSVKITNRLIEKKIKNKNFNFSVARNLSIHSGSLGHINIVRFACLPLYQMLRSETQTQTQHQFAQMDFEHFHHIVLVRFNRVFRLYIFFSPFPLLLFFLLHLNPSTSVNLSTLLFPLSLSLLSSNSDTRKFFIFFSPLLKGFSIFAPLLLSSFLLPLLNKI